MQKQGDTRGEYERKGMCESQNWEPVIKARIDEFHSDKLRDTTYTDENIRLLGSFISLPLLQSDDKKPKLWL